MSRIAVVAAAILATSLLTVQLFELSVPVAIVVMVAAGVACLKED